MRTPRKHVRRTASSLYRGLACGALSSCVASPQPGTPLPDPPDIKAPDLGRILGSDQEGVLATDAAAQLWAIELFGPSSSVAPDAQLFAINLDSDATPLSTAPQPDGSFSFPATTAFENDRFRLVSRRDNAHSRGVDLVVAPGTAPNAPGRLKPSTSPLLTCFVVTPLTDLTSDAEGVAITLDNGCDSEISVADLRLRFNDQGFALTSAPSVLAPGESARLLVTDTREPGAAERGDIVLLNITDTGAPAITDRYAISVYSRLAP